MKHADFFAIRINLFIYAVISVLLWSGCASVNQPAQKQPMKISLVYTGTKDTKADPKTFWPDPKLKEAFEAYWAARFDKQVPTRESFIKEAPYFQEMVDEDMYKSYIRGAVQNDLLEIQLQRVIKETDNLYKVECVIWVNWANSEKRDVYFLDEWINVRGKWYHVLKDILFLPAVS
jgi:hypothetical protein